jgi:glycosyltransferase involved in cell wall biosynthesis
MNRIEWIILDDGKEKSTDLFIDSGLKNIQYYPEDIKLNIGAKRNKLNSLATGEIIVCMDDDDYYPPTRIIHVVEQLISNPTYNICGSSELYIFYSDINKIYKAGPYNSNHATNGTLAYRRSYLENHKYDETVKTAEERSFLNDFTEPMLQLDPFKTQLLMSHSENTFDKKTIRSSSPMFKLTKYKLDRFISDTNLVEFYKAA